MALVPTIAAAAIAASRDLFGARRSHSSEVHAVCKKPNQCMRGRLGTAASAAHRPTVHATHGLTRLVRAALAVVRAANVPPVRRRQGSHRALPGRCSGRCGVHAPSQYITGGRRRPGTPVSRAGLRCEDARARSAWGRVGRPRRGRWVALRCPRFGAHLGCPCGRERLRPSGRCGDSEAAPGGLGLARGCCMVTLGAGTPARATLSRDVW